MLCSEKRLEYLKQARWRGLFDLFRIQVKSGYSAVVWMCETLFGSVTVAIRG
jgi:nitrate reductase NapE component